MSDCDCSGYGDKDFEYHSEFCPVWSRGRIAELEQEVAALKAEKARVEGDKENPLCPYPFKGGKKGWTARECATAGVCDCGIAQQGGNE